MTTTATVLGVSEDFLLTGHGANGAVVHAADEPTARSRTVARIMAEAKSAIAKASGFPQDKVKLSVQFAAD